MPSSKTAIGRLTKDAVLKETDKVDVVSFSIASNTFSQGKNVPDYVECVVFVSKNDNTKQVENVLPKLYKGRFAVLLNGEIRIEEYTNKENVTTKRERVYSRSLYDIIIDPDVDKLKAEIAELKGTSPDHVSPAGDEDEDEIPI